MSLYDRLNADERVQNCFPKFIALIDNKHVEVANVVNGQVYLTEVGEKLFAEAATEPEKAAPKKRAKKAEPEADVLAEVPDFIDDLGLGE